jgi:hypothetical protein
MDRYIRATLVNTCFPTRSAEVTPASYGKRYRLRVLLIDLVNIIIAAHERKFHANLNKQSVKKRRAPVARRVTKRISPAPETLLQRPSSSGGCALEVTRRRRVFHRFAAGVPAIPSVIIFKPKWTGSGQGSGGVSKNEAYSRSRTTARLIRQALTA